MLKYCLFCSLFNQVDIFPMLTISVIDLWLVSSRRGDPQRLPAAGHVVASVSLNSVWHVGCVAPWSFSLD